MNFNKDNMPKHIAIILDGNRRWAKNIGKSSAYGHKMGAEALVNIVRYANKIGLKYLSVYAFSTENWKRSEDEVSALMTIFQSFAVKYIDKAANNNIRIKFLGDMSAFNPSMQKSFNECMEKTKNNTGLTFNILLNYGGRSEIIKATKDIARDIQSGIIGIDDIDEAIFESKLYTHGEPDPDLMIRTSGEKRLSNFLPWQLVYTEFLFVDKYWPEFTEEDLDLAIEEYQKRHRKFGAN